VRLEGCLAAQRLDPGRAELDASIGRQNVDFKFGYSARTAKEETNRVGKNNCPKQLVEGENRKKRIEAGDRRDDKTGSGKQKRQWTQKGGREKPGAGNGAEPLGKGFLWLMLALSNSTKRRSTRRRRAVEPREASRGERGTARKPNLWWLARRTVFWVEMESPPSFGAPVAYEFQRNDQNTSSAPRQSRSPHGSNRNATKNLVGRIRRPRQSSPSGGRYTSSAAKGNKKTKKGPRHLHSPDFRGWRTDRDGGIRVKCGLRQLDKNV